MIVTVSAVKEYQLCPQKWAHSFVANKVPVSTPVPFTIGKLWHSYREGCMNGDDPAGLLVTLRGQAEASATELDAQDRFKQADGLRRDWENMEQLASHFKDRFDGPTVCVEMAMTAPLGTLPNGELVQVAGIPDRVRRIGGKLVHTQTRTLSESTPMAPYLRAFARNTHELVYAWLIQQAYPGEPYFGSELQVLRKARLWSDRKCSSAGTKWHAERSRLDCPECHYEGRVRTQLHTPEELLVQELVPIDPTQVQVALQDVMQVAFGMQRVLAGEPPVQNRDADLGRFGNSLCAYFDVCSGTAKLDDPTLFKVRENRYDEPVLESANEGDRA
jgi:hypothetical protein